MQFCITHPFNYPARYFDKPKEEVSWRSSKQSFPVRIPAKRIIWRLNKNERLGTMGLRITVHHLVVRVDIAQEVYVPHAVSF
ncbi:hypothetical protein GCM10023310_04630 [Paenibacillus vulneris]|uniref:Uncharacterized protein n=1 Tax=Paenibacillus vulneris TaxID=1133364 RepID=A0ABW3UMS1_9BACL